MKVGIELVFSGTICTNNSTDDRNQDQEGATVFYYHENSKKNSLLMTRLAGKNRKLEDVDFSTVQGEEIPLERIYPQFSLSHIRLLAPTPLPDDTFIKQPNFLYYNHDGLNDDHISQCFLREALCCEELMRYPHQSVGKYQGCHVVNDRVVSLCFKKYEESLLDVIQKRPYSIDTKQCLFDILMGIIHLHKLGYAHNCISPANIMLDSTGAAIITDFSSALRIGQKLNQTFGAVDPAMDGYSDKNATISEERNDLYTLNKIEELLKSLD